MAAQVIHRQPIFQSRQQNTANRLKRFRKEVQKHLSGDTSKIIGAFTCIYVTGSGGRGELSKYSDLDAFVLRVGRDRSNLDAILIQNAILRATRTCHFPDPSREGEFLKMHTVSDMTRLLGRPEDDTENTFTARMLLLLESTPILGEVAYREAVRLVVNSYWKNYEGHLQDYLPIILLNDIVRYWRIVLLNYEAKNLPADEAAQNPAMNADRRLRSYKLRFSRCMTCFSAVTYLLAATTIGHNNVRKKVVLDMVRMRPLERLMWIADRFSGHAEICKEISGLFDLYASFLQQTDAPKQTLLRRFDQTVYRRARSREGTLFGNRMFDLVARLGIQNPLYRYLVV